MLRWFGDSPYWWSWPVFGEDPRCCFTLYCTDDCELLFSLIVFVVPRGWHLCRPIRCRSDSGIWLHVCRELEYMSEYCWEGNRAPTAYLHATLVDLMEAREFYLKIDLSTRKLINSFHYCSQALVFFLRMVETDTESRMGPFAVWNFWPSPSYQRCTPTCYVLYMYTDKNWVHTSWMSVLETNLVIQAETCILIVVFQSMPLWFSGTRWCALYYCLSPFLLSSHIT